MTSVTSWRPSNKSSMSELAAKFAASPFTRLARAHAFSVAGDTLVALALSSSLFFSIKPDAARTRVALYLVLTMTPFAVVGPLIGPAIDRMAGGRRLMVLLTALTRCVSAVLMISNMNSLLLFPLAFIQLVSSKSYSVAKCALVPTTVARDSELVEANSKLNLLAGAVGLTAAIPALPFLALDVPQFVVALAAVMFLAAVVAAWQLPRTQIASEPMRREEKAELRTAGVVLAASATAVMRGIVGFMTFAIAFWFRRTGTAVWWFGVVLGFSTLGTLVGAAIAPVLRRSAKEETILWGALSSVALVGVVAAVSGGRTSAAVLAGTVGFAASAGRLAFDSIVQRDAPDANRGQSFAGFETKFQMAWVASAFIPVVIPFAGWLLFAVIAIAATAAVLTYLLGQRHVRSHGALPTPLWLQARRKVEEISEQRRSEFAERMSEFEPPPPQLPPRESGLPAPSATQKPPPPTLPFDTGS